MTTGIPVVDSISPSDLLLEVYAPDGSVATRTLERGNVLVVGSSPACGLRLAGPQVAGMHCTIEYKENGITIRDWDTESGTFLDGRQIAEANTDHSEFELQIAEFRVQSRPATPGVVSQRPDAAPHPTETNPPPHAPTEALGQSPASPDFDTPGWLIAELEREDGRKPLTHEIKSESTDEVSHVDIAPTENAPLEDDSDLWDSPEEPDHRVTESGYRRVPDKYLRDDFQDEAAELMQVEVEALRAELAERDQRLRELDELSQFETDSPESEEGLSTPEIESLVGRLEDLLTELEQSDIRIAMLNETLRTSEEAVQTADEERQQLEAWLSEVDRRVGHWEEEWRAERECLNKTIAELTEQRDRAEQRLAQGADADESGQAAEQFVQELREQNALLQATYRDLEQERNQLKVRIQDGNVADVERKVSAAVDHALREERLQLAQEKASLAREKSNLMKQQAELRDHLERKAQTTDSADHRIRAFREHLREIHEQEPHLNQGPSLSQRIGKLWRKIEGRPLDTD